MVDYVVVHYHRPDGSAAADCFWRRDPDAEAIGADYIRAGMTVESITIFSDEEDEERAA